MLARWLILGEWRAHPVRALVAIAAIAIGVALGFAIHLINAAALNEFGAALQGLAGQAELQVRATEPSFDEALYADIARHRGVAEAAPVLELEAAVSGAHGTLKLIGIDALRAPTLSPQLLPLPDANAPQDILADDAIFLSPAAQTWLHKQTGERMSLRVGAGEVTLRVAGTLAQARAGQRLAVLDIGTAQWRLAQLGKLSRIDLRLEAGLDRAAFQHSLQTELNARYPGRFLVEQPGGEAALDKQQNVSRAYRVNLTVLALVALFTGAFLVFSTQALSVVRRRSQFALLRVLGLERGQLLRQILREGLALGVVGSALGVAGGYAIAAATLRLLGGDLGAGFFAGVAPELQPAPLGALVYFLLGLGVAVAGCLAPALDAARAAPAAALKSGNEEAALATVARVWPGLLCLALAGVFVLLPPVYELPIFGYLAVALLLVGAISLMPRFAATLFGAIARRAGRLAPVPAMALARLANAPGQASVAMGGVLSSFSLMVAMAIMVASFRVSLDDWMRHILPADLYVRAAMAGDSAALGPAEQRAMAALPGLQRVEFLRTRAVQLDPARPAVALIARDFDLQHPDRALFLVGPSLPVPSGATPVWVSEAMIDLYQTKPGSTLRLPIGGQLRALYVAGVWRDYARPTGSVVLPLASYRAFSGDLDVSDAALYVQPGVKAETLAATLRAQPYGADLVVVQPETIHSISLQVFDRSFAVTYLLEGVAILVGLFGVAATFSAQTIARAREFGMLRHIGVTRAQVLGQLALEGAALTGLGIVCGFALGFVISLVLVDVVNPQSFHWSMELHLPWPLIGAVAALLLGAASLTALGAGRHALSGGPIRAVREDW
ncbi:FtsX-like permease family protein [Massilia sp. TS11]|uniref:FtsX-like permease family protein n=1 Tax=Massilia sp. TS11 TaxID=2908003 RepID=UPI001EDB2E6C|nr:FtsX-like permease family protein [Massilia sp. TS11]MCG2584617.1 FtsX-like permease family protein [Massilia sp. TS11]